MQLTQWLLLLITAIPLAFVVAGRLRMDLAALLMATLLGLLQFAGLGMLGPANSPHDAVKSIAGFSQSVVITLISLFIITRGLEKSGVTLWIANHLIRIGGTNTGRLIALFATVTALLSLFMNNLAAGALILPSAMEAARRTGIKPSKLLIPVAYGSLLGGSATYFTTANIIMSDLLPIAHPPQAPLNILDYTPTGGLIAIAGILFLWLFGDRLLPNHEPGGVQGLVRMTGSELEKHFQIGERLWEARVKPDSVLLGQTLTTTEIGRSLGVTVSAIQHGSNGLITPGRAQTIAAHDHLWLIGREEKVTGLASFGLEILPVGSSVNLSQLGVNLAEVILAPHSGLQGTTLKEADFRKRYDLTVIALKRGTRSYRTDVGDIVMAFGDSLLVAGEADSIQALHRSPDLIVFEPDLNDRPIHFGKALITTAITFAAIGASIAGVPIVLSVLAGAVLTLLLKILTMEEAFQAVEWQAIFLIAGMYAVSQSMVQTGLANLFGTSMLAAVSPFGSLGLAAGAYLLTALLTQLMGGQVAALVTGPVTISAAITMGVNPQAIAVATAIGCSASFFTPMSHPLNILMIAPANYKFIDFIRAGWLLTILSFAMLLLGLVLFWKL